SAYALTNYRAQGQTISHVVVDIARPQRGGLTLFNLYVALSRNSGRNAIHLPRDFDGGMLLCSHLPDMQAEDGRLTFIPWGLAVTDDGRHLISCIYLVEVSIGKWWPAFNVH
ncbi:hypothetical protein EDD16DRAFT_1468499, partial [Pisolithus croceorrhizus]